MKVIIKSNSMCDYCVKENCPAPGVYHTCEGSDFKGKKVIYDKEDEE